MQGVTNQPSHWGSRYPKWLKLGPSGRRHKHKWGRPNPSFGESHIWFLCAVYPNNLIRHCAMNPDNPPNPLSRRWWEPSLRRSWKELFCGCLVLISLLCIPKATLRLDYTLMGHGSQKSFYSHLSHWWQQKKIKVSKGKSCRGQSPGTSFQLSSPSGATSTGFLHQRHMATCMESCQPGNSPQPWSPGFLLG